jgi:hypothetical protein
MDVTGCRVLSSGRSKRRGYFRIGRQLVIHLLSPAPQIFGVEMLDNVDTGLRKKIVLIGTSRQEELTVCTVKTGLNDFLDYISLSVTLLLPAALGPLPLLLALPLRPCCPALPALPDQPSPVLIAGLTTICLSSYSLHLVISELYVSNSFVFLFVKNILGFLFLVLTPVHIILAQEDIRTGLVPVFGSSVLCPAATRVSIGLEPPSPERAPESGGSLVA